MSAGKGKLTGWCEAPPEGILEKFIVKNLISFNIFKNYMFIHKKKQDHSIKKKTNTHT
jgi:hypothetical protein